MAIKTLRSELIRDACRRRGISLAEIKAASQVSPSFFYKVVLGDKRSGNVDRVIIDFLDIEQELTTVDRLMNQAMKGSINKVANSDLDTAPYPSERIGVTELKTRTSPEERTNKFHNPLRARYNSRRATKLIVLKLRDEIRSCLDQVINQLKRPLTDDDGRIIEGATLNKTIFVEKSMNRYNRLCCDGAEPLLNLDQDGPFPAEISMRIEERQIRILQLKGEKNGVEWRTMLRAIIEWRLQEVIEELELNVLP